uniref:NADH-ubiquinone oxidoreductase chain 1 n=1 Tax=Habroteleia persimilis TaxID=2496286 RepID=A0A3S8V185_9HYME|nr:NADH dehydrogenase subunit 1 [Habroteleia persimilis]
MYNILMFLNYIILIIFILISVSFFTLFERKILSYIQFRKGPNKVGFIGILQAISDGVKLFSNEFMFLYQINMFMYLLSPIFMFLISLLLWMIYPFMNLMMMKNFMLFMFCLLMLNVYPMMFAGYSSNSIYSMLGSLRSISQTISYEVSFIFLVFSMLILLESLSINMFIYYKNLFILFMFPLSMMLYISILAELNRTPFDFSEGESELISGYNIEYMSSGFALIFLGEYLNIMFLMLMFTIMNFYLNFIYMYIIWMYFLFMVIMIRSLLPRLRYDKLMILIWLNYLPISLNYLMYIMIMKFMFMIILF